MSERKLIPVTAEATGLCGSCNGACCRKGTIMELTDEERDFLEKGGAELYEVSRPAKTAKQQELAERLAKFANVISEILILGPDNPEYVLLQDCPYLVEAPNGQSLCSVYDDPGKPSICSAFEPGNRACLTMREARLPGPAS